MAIYVMGDLHSCFNEFKALLAKIAFNPTHDTLYLVGDLINRGPKSVEMMRYLLHHEDSIKPVLGNHDLSFLVYEAGETRLRRGDTYDTLLNIPEREEIRDYLRRQPLMRYLPEYDIAIAHAGIPPIWSISEAQILANEIHALLNTEDMQAYRHLMRTMFGNTPAKWDEDLINEDRIRVIINYFSRMRYLYPDLSLDFANKQQEYNPSEMQPWFKYPRDKQGKTKLIYGHWASLGIHAENGTYCIDSGCVWQGTLSVLRIDSQVPELIQVN